MNNRPWTRVAGLAALCALSSLLFACTTSPAEESSPDAGTAPEGGKAPVNNPADVCANPKKGPASAPAGAVTIDPSDDRDLAERIEEEPAGTTFWFAPGTHSPGGGEYDQIQPRDGDTFIGAPGAILDGKGVNRYAFTGQASDVTIRFLTVQGFVSPSDEGVVNHDSGDGWVIENNVIRHNGGAGMMAGARQQVRGNCLSENGQYAINAFKNGDTITGLVLEGNEIVGNNTDDWEKRKPGCGCTGGVKFWAVDGADIRDNWVHDNKGTALWADTNNNDFVFEGNLIEGNDGSAIFYEISYNAIIRNNTIRGNNLVEGKGFVDRNDNFPSAAIYLSEAGGEPRVKARTDKIDIYGNRMENNWSGITLWENADRFCNSAANSSTGYCTRLVPDHEMCAQPGIAKAPLIDDCRWKTQRVDVHDNEFVLDPKVVECHVMCARMAVLSNYGTFPEWSPYQGEKVRDAITFRQHNRWHDNTYRGPWMFMTRDTDTLVDPMQWQAQPYSQDAGSTFSGGGG